VVVWAANDFKGTNKYKGKYGLAPEKFAALTELLRDARTISDHVILIGPGSARSWSLASTWDIPAPLARGALLQTGVTYYGGRGGRHMVKAPT